MRRVVRLVGAVTIALAVTATAQARVLPKPVGMLDCNGLSPIQAAVHRTAGCADIRGLRGGRFYDNGHYIGHDEPSLRLISDAPKSASDITVVERLPRDP